MKVKASRYTIRILGWERYFVLGMHLIFWCEPLLMTPYLATRLTQAMAQMALTRNGEHS